MTQPFWGAADGVDKFLVKGSDASLFSGDNLKSPYVIESPPFGGRTYLLCNDVGNVYSVPINADLQPDLNNASKVLDSSQLGAINAVDAVYDSDNDQWILLTDAGGDGVIAALTEDGSNNWTLQDSTTAFSSISDAGMSGFWDRNGDSLYTFVKQSTGEVQLAVLSGFGSRPLNLSDNGSPDIFYDFSPEVTIHKMQAMMSSSGYPMLLAESSTDAGWVTRLFHLPPIPDNLAYTPGAMVATEAPQPAQDYQKGGNMTHPHYTTMLGRPMILTQNILKRGGGIDHGIRAVEVDPSFLDPSGSHPLRCRALDANHFGTSNILRTFGADTVRITASYSATGPTLKIRENAKASEFETDNYAETDIFSPSAAGVTQHVYSDPAEFIQLRSSNGNTDLNWVDISVA